VRPWPFWLKALSAQGHARCTASCPQPSSQSGILAMHGRAAAIFALVTLVGVAAGARINFNEKLQKEATSLEAYRAKHADVVATDIGFIDFGKVVDWAKNEAKDIFKEISEQTMQTVSAIKDKITAHLANFKTLLKDMLAKCGEAVRQLKGDLVTGLSKLKNVAAAELPKFYEHFAGIKEKLAQARDALTAQLLAGSLTGAGEVIQEHVKILLAEAKTTAGSLKDQFTSSAGVLQKEATSVLKNVFESSKTKFTDAYSETFQNATVLVHTLIAEVKAELANGGKEIAGDITRLKASGEKLVDGVKTGAFAPSSPGSMLELSCSRLSRSMLQSQLATLVKAAEDLAGAAVQSTSSQTEQTVDVASSLGKRIGRFAIELLDQNIKPKLKELKENAIKMLNQKLDELRAWVSKAAQTAVEKLTKINAFVGGKAKELLDKYGPQAEAWAQNLQDQAVGIANAQLNIDKARDALQAALDKDLTKKAGDLRAQVARRGAGGSGELQAQLAAIEQEIFDKRTVAQQASKEAASSLEGLAAKASESVGRIKAAMQSAIAEGKAALAEELKALEAHAKSVWAMALGYGRECSGALQKAAADLMESKNAEEGWKSIVDAVADVGVNIANTIFKNNGSGQCKKSSHDYCCRTGKPCDCKKGAWTWGQCGYLAHRFCCDVGTPCDCSKPAL